MNKDQENQLYQDAIDFFGDLSQKVMVIEEMSELTKELCKELRDRGNIDHIAEELADVEITLSQIKLIYGIDELVQQHKEFKLNRFANIMKDLKEKQQES